MEDSDTVAMQSERPVPVFSIVELASRVPQLLRQTRLVLRRDGIGGRLARGAISSFVINVAGMGAAFGVQILLARTLGATAYGMYAYVFGWLNIILLLAKLDFDNTAIRFMGAYRGTQQWSLLHGFLNRSRQIVLVQSVGLALLAALLVWLLRERSSPALVASAFLAAAMLPLLAMTDLVASSLRGLQRVVAAQLPQMLARPLLFGIGIAVSAYVARVRVGAPLAIGLNGIASALTLGVSWYLLRQSVPREVAAVPPRYATREWWRVALGLLLIDAAQVVLSQQSDVVVVGSLVGTTASGHYGAASQLAMLVPFGATAVMVMATPLIAELFAQGRRGDLQRLVTTVGRWNACLALPVLVLLVIAGRFILGWYGPGFTDAYPVLVLLGVSQMIVAVLGVVAGYMVSMTGHQDAAALIVGASAALNLALTFGLTSTFGSVGAATATLLATLVRSVALTIYIRTRLGIRLLPFASDARSPV